MTSALGFRLIEDDVNPWVSRRRPSTGTGSSGTPGSFFLGRHGFKAIYLNYLRLGKHATGGTPRCWNAEEFVSSRGRAVVVLARPARERG